MNELSTTEDPTDAGYRTETRAQPFLFVVFDRDRPSLGGARYALSGVDTVDIGRGDARAAQRREGGRHLDLRASCRRVSKSHARLIAQRDGTWLLKDRDSRNGCLINGVRVSHGVVRDGDVIELGPLILRYRARLDAPKDAPTELDSAHPSTASPGFDTLLPKLASQLATLARIAQTNVSTLLIGETGTGKEVLTRGIHELSGRSGPLIAVNCGALTESLVESQLFGHRKGAFTGALRNEPGFLRSAHEGTLLLDEIGDMPVPAQATLLRVLQEREVVPVGETRPVKVDLRVVAATHRPLDQMAVSGTFRADLLARLSGYRHVLPPLRERLEDLGLLIRDILAHSDVAGADQFKFSAQMARMLFARAWTFNIRELVQILTVAAALAQDSVIKMEHLPATPRDQAPGEAPGGDATPAPQDMSPELLRAHLIALLKGTRGNVSAVARQMGKARMQIHRWMRALDINPADYRP